MKLPLAERSMRELQRRLSRISEAGDFHTDAGARVERARRTWGAEELPAISLWDNGEDVENGEGNSSAWAVKLNIEIEGAVQAGQECTGIELELIKADMKRAIFTESNGAVTDELGPIGAIAYIGATNTSREDGGDAEIVRLSVRVTIIEGAGNPYSKEDLSHVSSRLF